MDRLDDVWPEEAGGADFGSVFDEALSSSRYGEIVVLGVHPGVDWDAWKEANRPPPPWKGRIIQIAANFGPSRVGYSVSGAGTPHRKIIDLPPCSCALCTGTGPARDSG